VRNFLIRVPNWIGDALLARPVIETLRSHNKGTEIILLSHERVAPLFHDFGNLSKFRTRGELLLQSFSLRKRGIENALIFPLSFSSSFSVFITGARERIGFSSGIRDLFLTVPIDVQKFIKKEHLLDTFYRLLQPFSIERKEKLPTLIIGEKEREKASQFLRKIGLQEKSYVAVVPFSTYGPAKEWGVNRYKSLVKELLRNGIECLIMGSKEEVDRAKCFDEKKGLHNIVGKTDLLLAASLIEKASLVVTNDSGFSHLASSLRVPVLTIFGSTSPLWTRPLGESSHYIYVETPCSPCFRRKCFKERQFCMEAIKPEFVFKRIVELLGLPRRMD